MRATEINTAMKAAAVHALAELAREDVPDAVIRAYGGNPIRFGPEYIVPKPLDTRVLLKVVPAVAEAAVTESILNEEFTFNKLGQAANVLVFPDLASCNIAYKLMNRLAGAKIVGPLLMGIDRPFNVLQRNCEVENVEDLIAITAVQAQMHRSVNQSRG